MQYPWLLDGHKIFRVVIVVQLIIAVAIGLFTGELLAAFIFVEGVRVRVRNKIVRRPAAEVRPGRQNPRTFPWQRRTRIRREDSSRSLEVFIDPPSNEQAWPRISM